MVSSAYVTFGCDPEIFFKKAGKIIGAERVIPAEGLTASNYARYSAAGHEKAKAIVLDGVQAELHPYPEACRAHVGNSIANTFQTLRKLLKEKHPGVEVCFDGVVEVDQDELESLGPAARALGCAPSLNYYDPNMQPGVDGSTCRLRSAGGHIHMGLHPPIFGRTLNPAARKDPTQPTYTTTDERMRLVPILDTIVGNTCVLIDRNPLAAERRKVYGRAGEYRLPKHGLEYRTLSNFWLRDYKLFSFVTGLARLSASVLVSTLTKSADLERKLLTSVDLDKIRRAIDTNDLELAKENYKIVREFVGENVEEYMPAPSYFDGLIRGKPLELFDQFCEGVWKGGLEYWFPENPLDSWADMPEGHGVGWECWLTGKFPKLHEQKQQEEAGSGGNS